MKKEPFWSCYLKIPIISRVILIRTWNLLVLEVESYVSIMVDDTCCNAGANSLILYYSCSIWIFEVGCNQTIIEKGREKEKGGGREEEEEDRRREKNYTEKPNLKDTEYFYFIINLGSNIKHKPLLYRVL